MATDCDWKWERAAVELKKQQAEAAYQARKNGADELYTAPSGATSRSKAPDYTLCPAKELLEAATARFQYGLDRGHARNNWRSGKDDATYVAERACHALTHFMRAIDGTGGWEDIEAAICNLSMMTWWRKNGNGLEKAFPNLAPPPAASCVDNSSGGLLTANQGQSQSADPDRAGRNRMGSH